MNNKNIGKKNIILIVIVLVLILVVGSSLAFFGWSSTSEGKDRIVDVTVSSGSGECAKATDNTKLLVPTSTKENGRVITMTAKQIMAENASITWTLTVKKLKTDETTTNGLKNESFRYELKNKTTGVSYGSGNFANITDENNTITFSTTEETLDYNVNYEFILYLWIDGITFDNNPLDMASQTYSFDMNCSIIGVETKVEAPKYLSAYVSNLYTQNDTATNGDDTYGYTTYDLDTNNKLMKDVDGNIRYYGASPNNYIYFNCDTYPDANCELWRIIGVFGDKVKLIKNSMLGNYSWDYEDYNGTLLNTTDNSNWESSTLKALLNGAYLNNENITYYNYSSNGPTEVLANFNANKKGIKDSTRSLIADTAYNLGTLNQTFEIYVKESYELERDIQTPDSSYSTVWSGKIGLPYPSDYGYAVNFKECNKTLNEYNDSKCTNNNWMTSLFGNEDHTFFINPYTISVSQGISVASKAGQVANTHVIYNNNVFPVLFLNANTVISTIGDGSEGNPYRLLV